MDFDKLVELREKASEDKAELFDFYHDNWDELFELAKRKVEEVQNVINYFEGLAKAARHLVTK